MKPERMILDCPEWRLGEKREEEDLPALEGHAAVFDVETEILGFFGGFVEKIARGAFTQTLQEVEAKREDVVALVDHNPTMIIGRSSAGTLELREDDIGLWSKIFPPNTSVGRDIVENIRVRNVSKMSFGFIVRKQEVEERDDELPLRTVLQADLFDVSPVSFPAFPQTDIDIQRNYRTSQEIWEDSIACHLSKNAIEYYRKKALATRARLIC